MKKEVGTHLYLHYKTLLDISASRDTISPSHFYSLFTVFKIKITSNLRLYSNDFLNQKESIGKGKVDFFSKVILK